jgi:XTP/dITP diphosphohydrolase
MKRIVVASRNRKKAQELAELLEGLPFQVVSLDLWQECPEVIEDGATFQENSLKKAQEVSQYTGEWTLADDSGLSVDVLKGEPGVFSARYGGYTTDLERNQYLLAKMTGIPLAERTARFVCCATLFGEGHLLYQVTEVCEGQILLAPQGSYGFGYDPIFQPCGEAQSAHCICGREGSMAELPPAEKHRISHRGKALAAVRNYLCGEAPQALTALPGLEVGMLEGRADSFPTTFRIE